MAKNSAADGPESWKASVESILADMGVQNSDMEAVNLISLVMQQEARTLLQTTLEQAETAGRSKPTVADARVACHDYTENSYIHPHLLEDNIRGLTRLINSRPLPETLQDPQSCANFNLCAPTWKLTETESGKRVLENMKIHIHKRSGKFIGSLDISPDASTDDLKRLFYETCKLGLRLVESSLAPVADHFYPERQRYNIGSAEGPLLKDGSLASNEVTDDSSLYFKDLGVQISWRLVFVLEYLGPLLIVPVLWHFPSFFYRPVDIAAMERNTTQRVAIFLMLFHFAKREVETLFVHRFSNATMPITRLPINCFHYWILCGASIGYYLCHPKYRAPFGNVALYILAAVFLIFEVLNFRTHIILRNLRPRGTKTRGIPKGCGFEWVSCANYLWETCAWVTFSILSMCLTSYVFTIIAFVQMSIWALKKRESYRKSFPQYPRSRKAIIPFII